MRKTWCKKPHGAHVLNNKTINLVFRGTLMGLQFSGSGLPNYTLLLQTNLHYTALLYYTTLYYTIAYYPTVTVLHYPDLTLLYYTILSQPYCATLSRSYTTIPYHTILPQPYCATLYHTIPISNDYSLTLT